MADERPDLNKRKAVILATIVYEYVETAEPVASNALTQKYQFGVSSATIRNEMAELEASGYLVQPHTSAGRVPSDVGYRTFVDRLMLPEPLDAEDHGRIRAGFSDASRELGEALDNATKLIGALTNGFAFSVARPRETSVFRHIQIIWLGPRSGLAVVVTSMGVVGQTPFDLQQDVDADELTRLSNKLNAKFGGKAFHAIERTELQGVVTSCGLSSELGDIVANAIDSARRDMPVVAVSGAQRLLDQPEFRDLKKLRAILNVVEEQKALYDLVADAFTGDEPWVRIGHELGEGSVAECSVVAVPFRVHEGATGMLALLGPRRMRYGRLLSVLASTASTLTRRLAPEAS